MTDTFNLQELIKMKKLPAVNARPTKIKKEHRYHINQTEDAVTYPNYAPTKDAFIFESKSGKKPWFRKSESERAYSKKTLIKDFGLKNPDFKKVEEVSRTYCEKSKSFIELYTLSSFHNFDAVEDGFDDWYKIFLNKVIKGHKRDVTQFHSGLDYDIYASESSVIIDFECAYIDISIDLKTLCQQRVRIKSADPKEDFRQQVIIPLSRTIDEIKSILINGMSETVVIDDNVISVKSLDKEEIKSSIYQYIKAVKSERDKQKVHQSLMSQKPYHELFPCRENTRKITLYVAPTNSGKTYHSCNQIKDLIMEDDRVTAQCFFPLRALAAQLKDEFVEEGFPCDLITGEERELEPNSRIISCTTEIMDPGEFKDVIFIDECQMIFDKNRQAAYTRAILGAHCNNLLLAVAPFYAEALIRLLEVYTNDTIEVVKLERLCPLIEHGEASLSDIEKGDVIVAFRTKSIHMIAEELSSRGLNVGVIYGRMSPSARRSMIKQFMEKDCDCLVATDAIGMGLSIPAKRVFIAEGTKYDGVSVRPLEEEEMRQVAGRAGRYKFYDKGYYGVLDVSPIIENSTPLSMSVLLDAIDIKDAFKSSLELNVLPDKNVMRSVSDINLESTLMIWKSSVTSHKNVSISKDSFELFIKKAKFLDTLSLDDRELLVKLLFIIYPENKDNSWEKVYSELVQTLLSGDNVTFDMFYTFNFSGDGVVHLEDYSMYLTMLSQFQRIFPDLLPKEYLIRDEQDKTGEALSTLLLSMYTS